MSQSKEKMSPVSANWLLSSLSNKLKLFFSHSISPRTRSKVSKNVPKWQKDKKLPFLTPKRPILAILREELF